MNRPFNYHNEARGERCETCCYLQPGRQGWYECHRNEPQVSVFKECDDEAIKPIAIWPSVATTDWCGQFVRRKKGA
ncbi:MAG: hypothetical protein RL425_1352 [Pseudomonadota bacterium]|jgi:hypothetical protein